MVKAVGIDHVVLNVADVERSLAWYCGELGLQGLRVAEWRRGEFGTAELADALEVALSEVTKRPQDPGRHRVTGWRTLAGCPHGPGALIRPTERL